MKKRKKGKNRDKMLMNGQWLAELIQLIGGLIDEGLFLSFVFN